MICFAENMLADSYFEFFFLVKLDRFVSLSVIKMSSHSVNNGFNTYEMNQYERYVI